MIGAEDMLELRRILRRLYREHGCRAVVHAVFDIGRGLDEEFERPAPPPLAHVIKLDDHRRPAPR